MQHLQAAVDVGLRGGLAQLQRQLRAQGVRLGAGGAGELQRGQRQGLGRGVGGTWRRA